MSKQLTQAAFWLVWSPTGHRPPNFMHPSEKAAVTEAERLARAHPGKMFVVLESKAARLVDSMISIDFEHEIPF